jgi:hypothetical protein
MYFYKFYSSIKHIFEHVYRVINLNSKSKKKKKKKRLKHANIKL